ncbi:hypothetical protein [Streptomyces noursei]|uniref:hypothetical protein n=1 Tax=Streptomyces noursei TaxID=1971 RepID=UPI0016755BC3|nr:hypothetical protein [Streptomyces noursei]MCZ1020270.1 hypothetical protein [Streptomyces noursei]GGX41496.1 hypothetical protein GCM10010341_74350 [Streptomyces noursei]
MLALAVVISYVLSSLALSPRGYFEGRQPPPPPEAIDTQLTALGINDRTPLWERFGNWLGHALHGDLGRTLDSSDVGTEFGCRIGVSLRLLLAGTLLGTVGGVLLGTWGAVRQYRFSDRAVTLFAFLLLSTPTTVTATPDGTRTTSTSGRGQRRQAHRSPKITWATAPGRTVINARPGVGPSSPWNEPSGSSVTRGTTDSMSFLSAWRSFP